MAEPTSLYEELQRSVTEQQKKLQEARVKAAESMQIDEAHANRVVNAVMKTGLPPEVAEADLDNIEQKLSTKTFDIERYRKTSPVWTNYLTENPYSLAALAEDTKNMDALERWSTQIGLGWDAGWAQVDMADLDNQRIEQGGEFTPEQEEQYKRAQQLQQPHDFASRGAIRWLVKTAKLMPNTISVANESLKAGLVTGTGFAGMAASVTAPSPIIGDELSVPVAFGLGMGVGGITAGYGRSMELERGFAYGEYREMGLTHEDAKWAATAVGAVNAGLEFVSFGVAGKVAAPAFRKPKAVIAKLLTKDLVKKPTLKRAMVATVGRFGEVLGTEVVTEVLQESTAFWAGELIKPDAYGTGLSSWSRWGDRVADTAVEILQGAALMSAITPGVRFLGDWRLAREADRMGAVFEQLAAKAKASETRKKLPDAYKQFIERLRDQGATDSVWIDANRLVEYFQESGKDSDTVANSLNMNPEELAEAVLNGADIAIPLDSYIDQIAPTTAGIDLVNDVKGSQNSMSIREAQNWRANNPELVKALDALADQADEKIVDAEIEKVVQDITERLVGLDFGNSDSARKMAEQLRGIGVLARRAGKDPLELYNKVLAGIRRKSEFDISPKDIDVYVDPLLDRLRARDFPTQREMHGPSLLDFIGDKGGIDPTDPELLSMDFEAAVLDLGASKAQMKRWKDKGNTLSDIAEAASEAGYLTENSENALVDALRRETFGEPVYGVADFGNDTLKTLNDNLDSLQQLLDEAGLDVQTMTNEEIRAALEERSEFDQIKSDELQSVTEGVLAGALPPSSLPMISEQQDFGGIMVDLGKVRIDETGKRAKVKISAQSVFNDKIQAKKTLKMLLDCVSG